MQKNLKLELLKKNILLQILSEISQDLENNIYPDLHKHINYKNIKKITDESIKQIKNNDFTITTILFEMNIFKNTQRLKKLLPYIKLTKSIKKYIFWNLFLYIYNKDISLKRYLDKSFINIDYRKIKNIQGLDFQVYSNIIYKKIIALIYEKDIKIEPILFLKNINYDNQEKFYQDSIKERFNIESEFIIKSYHLLFDKQKGFFFNEKEIKHQALKSKLLYNLKLSI